MRTSYSNFAKYLSLTVAVLVLSLASTACSHSAEEPSPTPQTTPSNETVKVKLDLNLSIDDSQLRDIQLEVKDGAQKGAFTIHSYNAYVWLIFRSEDIDKPMYSLRVRPIPGLIDKGGYWWGLSIGEIREIPAEIFDGMLRGEYYAALASYAHSTAQTFSFDEEQHRLYLTSKPTLRQTILDESSYVISKEKRYRYEVAGLFITPWIKLEAESITDEHGETHRYISYGSLGTAIPLHPMGALRRYNLKLQPGTFGLAEYSAPETEEGEEDGSTGNTDLYAPIRHGGKVVFYQDGTASNYQDLGESTLSAQLARVAGVIDLPQVMSQTTWRPSSLVLSGDFNGYYDFANAELTEGAFPEFVSTGRTTIEYLFPNIKDSNAPSLDAASQDLGYLYVYGDTHYAGVELRMRLVNSSSHLRTVQQLYRWGQNESWTLSSGSRVHMPKGVSGIIGGTATPITPENKGYGNEGSGTRMDGIWDFDSFYIKNYYGILTDELATRGQTQRVEINIRPRAYIKKLKGRVTQP